MAKVRGYDPDDNDWFWAMYGPKGSVIREGKIASCIECNGDLKLEDNIKYKLISNQKIKGKSQFINFYIVLAIYDKNTKGWLK